MLKISYMFLRRMSQKLWVRVGLFALLSVLTLPLAIFVERFLPRDVATLFDKQAVMPVLQILASSMLTVSTFSLGIMVSAHRAAAGQATPRVHRILIRDTTTQTVIATFIGAFVYSLSAIMMFQADLYGEGAPVVVMGITLLIVGLMTVAMLRWIAHLSELGSMDATMEATTRLAAQSLYRFHQSPALGGTPMNGDTVWPENLTALPAPKSGFLQAIDAVALDKQCATPGNMVYVAQRPGKLVLAGEPLARISGQVTTEMMVAMTRAFVIGAKRTYDQDAAFGLLVLSETASRALSPGINDPGTAIEALTELEKLLWDFSRKDPAEPPRCPRIFVPELGDEALIDSAFAAIARDGASQIEVAIHLQKALKQLARCGRDDLSAAATAMSELAMAHANAALRLDAEKERLQKHAL